MSTANAAVRTWDITGSTSIRMRVSSALSAVKLTADSDSSKALWARLGAVFNQVADAIALANPSVVGYCTSHAGLVETIHAGAELDCKENSTDDLSVRLIHGHAASPATLEIRAPTSG